MSFLNRSRWLSAVIVLVLAVVIIFSQIPSNASAQELSDRGLTMSTSLASVSAIHEFSFHYTSTTPIGSVLFEYCESPVDGVPCIAPPGLDASAATLTGQTGETGFSIFSQTANTIVISRPAVAITNPQSSYTFTGVTNPNTTFCIGTVVPNCTFYGRIYTFASEDASGAYTDFGGLAASTNPQLNLTSIVPPILFFCVGVTITGDDCTTATGNIVDLGILSPFSASAGTSEMVAATNAEFGLSIAADGTTMTSGNNSINALPVPTVSAPGNSQFGFNLRANTNPKIGTDPSGPGVANPAPNYDIVNEYLFNPGDVVATSPAVTDYRKFTESYLANVTPAQPPGVYTSTITYVCTATF